MIHEIIVFFFVILREEKGTEKNLTMTNIFKVNLTKGKKPSSRLHLYKNCASVGIILFFHKMASHQQCRYRDTIKHIPIRQLNEQSYVFLQDIQDHFRDVAYCTFDEKTIPFEHDNNGERLNPWRIQTIEGKIIDCHPSQSTIQQYDLTELVQQLHDEVKKVVRQNDAILRQTFELVEKTMPCNFIVFPEDTSPMYNPANWFRMKYRLYFLCEYEYENGTQYHLAYHEGYELKEPREFFKEYGPYIRKMLRFVKFSLSVGGVVAAPLARLASGTSCSSLTMIRDSHTVDKLGIQLEKLDAILAEVTRTSNIKTNNNDIRYVEGPDCRALEYFLKKPNERNDHGNLYQANSSDGHIRWTCVRHCDTAYCENARQELRSSFENLGGEIQDDIAIIKGKEREKQLELFRIIQQGLPISSIVLRDIEIDENDFDNLLGFISRQSLISRLTIENMIVKNLVGNMNKRTIVLKLRKVLEYNVKLSIEYSFEKSIRSFEPEFFDSISSIDPRLVLQVRSIENEGALKLVGTTQQGFSLSLNKYDDKIDVHYRRVIDNILTKVNNVTKISLFTGNILKDNNDSFCLFFKTTVILQELTVDCSLTKNQIKILLKILEFNKTLKKLNIINIWREKNQLEMFSDIFLAIQMNQSPRSLNPIIGTDQIRWETIGSNVGICRIRLIPIGIDRIPGDGILSECIGQWIRSDPEIVNR